MEYLFGIDLIDFIKAIGLLGVFAVIFAESGVFVGFFFPGDSLLFTAGFLASQGFLPIVWLVTGSFFAAVLGDSFGYAFGRRVGPAIFTRQDSFFLHRDHIERAQKFYERHGGKTIILARFIPIVRTFAPILAGVGTMRYTTFLFYNVFGAFIWAVGVPLVGFWLGSVIPGVDRYILPIVFLIILLSILPAIVHITKNPEYLKYIKEFLIRKFR